MHPIELAAAALEARPLAPISDAIDFPTALSSTKASACSEKVITAPLLFLPKLHAASPLAGRRPTAPFGAVSRSPPEPPMPSYI
jgi:hypothetical protein